MISLKGLILTAATALLMIVPTWGACPEGNVCWIDDDNCGTCISDGSDCGVGGLGGDCPKGNCIGEGEATVPGTGCEIGGAPCSGDAFCLQNDWGVCTGTGCEIGGAPCSGDAFCLQNDWGVCKGTCEGTTESCYGDQGCAVCVDGAIGSGTSIDPYCTFDAAYQAAQDGDTLYVRPGTYKQCANLYGASLPFPEDRAVHVLAQAFAESDEDTATIGDTIIDGTGVCHGEPVVTLFGSDASMKGITVTGGQESGLFISGSVTITSNRITGNSSTTGGGIFVYPASCYYDGIVDISITDNEVSDNLAVAGPVGDEDQDLGDGGGIGVLVVEKFLGGCDSVVNVDILDNRIFGNRVENRNTVDGARLIAKGGGIYAATAMEPNGTANVNIKDNELFDNGRSDSSLASAGGGIFVATDLAGFGAESIVVRGNTIGPDNVAHEGGGIAAWASSRLAGQHSIAVEKNQIIDNTAVSASVEGAGGGASLRVEAIDLAQGDSVRLQFSQNEVSGNFSDASDGGGIRASFLSERSVSEPVDGNPNPADEMSLIIEDNTIRDNTSNVGGAGALLLVLSDSDPEFPVTGNCTPATRAAAGATIEFKRNLVAGNRGNNLTGFTEVGAGILTIPSTYGEAEAHILIEETTLAGNTLGNDFESSGGLETLPFADKDCADHIDATIEVAVDRSIVDGNDGFGVGGTPLGVSAPPGTLVVPVTNSYLYDNDSGNFEPELYPAPSPSNKQSDPQLTGAHAPAACSPVFREKVCEGTTTTCLDSQNCAAGVACLAGVGFHGNPDVAPDFIIDGLDVLDLAVAFSSTDAPDHPRFSVAADLDHNGVVDPEDLTYMASQFGRVCQP